MQLFLASILSCAALLVGVLAHADWKPYSSTEGSSVAMSDDSWAGMILADMEQVRQFTDIAASSDDNPAELLAGDRRDGGSRAIKTLERTRDVAIQRERKLLTESAGLLARHDGHALVFTDAAGRNVKVRFDFDEHSLEMLADKLSKGKLANVKKVFSTLKISELAERELRKEFARGQTWERKERRQAQREAQSEIIRVERTEPVEGKREQSDYLRCECPDKIDRTNP